MNTMRPILIFCCLLFLLPLSAQQLTHRQGELIVRFEAGAAAGAKEWMEERGEITSWSPLGRSLNIYLVRFDHNLHSAERLRADFWRDDAIQQVQLNGLISLRARPDDPRYDDQWHHRNVGQFNGVTGADHNVEIAWNTTTGGVTVNGDTIVVAVLDDGTDLDHEDLVANLWRNHDEIPDNGIDDDGNGYIDDYFGYDTNSNDADPGAANSDNHGTPVAGIIGARGDNGVGVAGVNWNVKIMSIRNGFLTAESEVLEAYLYALESRIAYDASGGSEGAYVVATNASWGRDFGDVDDSPIWCNLYDELGAAGILSAGATINGNVDVDAEGDLPTNCPSDYLIGVTNLNTNDQKVTGAGFGTTSIDLGAYGEDVFTTDNGNGYGYFGGTSAATPMVAGAIALLYAAPCPAFGELLAADPAAAAILVRETLLETVAPNSSLNGVTVTGGRLDAGAAMNRLMERCEECFAPTSFAVIPVDGSATSVRVSWRAIASLGSVDLRYRVSGTEEWTTVNNLTGTLTTVSDLNACVAYDFQLTGACGNDEVATAIITASTDGCCEIPEDFRVEAFPNALFRVDWTTLLAAQSYRIRYRRAGEEEWTNRTAAGTTGILGIGGVDPCTDYEFEFQTNCDTLVTDFGSRQTVRSFGCGACLEEEYCTPDDYDNERDFIAEVNFGGVFRRQSGRETDGYRNAGQVGTGSFVRGGVYRLELTPDAGGSDLDNEGWKVYVDWDHNGSLTSNEVIAELDNPATGPAVVDVTIPENAITGLTRMRVMMEFGGVSGTSCTSSGFGEVEDYCLDITDAEGCPPPTSVTATYLEDIDETVLSWSGSAAVGGNYRVRYRPRGTQDDWVTTDVDQPTTTIRLLNLCATYELEIASLCDGEPGDYRLFLFQDDCTSTPDLTIDPASWSVFPNPAQHTTTIRYDRRFPARQLRLLDATGRVMVSLPPLTGGTEIAVADLPAGLYFVELRLVDGRRGIRRLVVR